MGRIFPPRKICRAQHFGYGRESFFNSRIRPATEFVTTDYIDSYRAPNLQDFTSGHSERRLRILVNLATITQDAWTTLVVRSREEDFHCLDLFSLNTRARDYHLSSQIFAQENLGLEFISGRPHIYHRVFPEQRRAVYKRAQSLAAVSFKTDSVVQEQQIRSDILAGKRNPLALVRRVLGIKSPYFIVMDTETSDKNFEDGARVVELAYMVVDWQGRVLANTTTLLRRPGLWINPGARNVHGITEEMLTGPEARAPREVYREFLQAIRGTGATGPIPIFGQNVGPFDIHLLNLEFQAGFAERSG